MTAAYADIVNGKFAFMSDDGTVKTGELLVPFIKMLASKRDLVTIGEWAANFGLTTVITLVPKQTFGSMGLGNAILEDRVKFIQELANHMYKGK
jgi:hypothetical protein